MNWDKKIFCTSILRRYFKRLNLNRSLFVETLKEVKKLRR